MDQTLVRVYARFSEMKTEARVGGGGTAVPQRRDVSISGYVCDGMERLVPVGPDDDGVRLDFQVGVPEGFDVRINDCRTGRMRRFRGSRDTRRLRRGEAAAQSS